MNFIRKKETPSVIERLRNSYEKAYEGAVDAITLDSENRHDEALATWTSVLDLITECKDFISSCNDSGSHYVKTHEEYQLLNGIQEIEKRGYTEIAQLRRYIQPAENQDSYFSQLTTWDSNGGSRRTTPGPNDLSDSGNNYKHFMVKTLRSNKSGKGNERDLSSMTASKAATVAWPDRRQSASSDTSLDGSLYQTPVTNGNSHTLRAPNQGFNKISESRKSNESKRVARKPVTPSPNPFSADIPRLTTPSLIPPPSNSGSRSAHSSLTSATERPSHPIKYSSASSSPPKQPALPSPKPRVLKPVTKSSQSPVSGRTSPGPKPSTGPKPATVPKPAALRAQSTPAVSTAAKPAVQKINKPKTQASSSANSKHTSPKPSKETQKVIVTETEENGTNSDSEWDAKTKEIIKNLRGVDENAAKQVLNEIVLKGDEVHWDDIAGLEQAKASLKEAVVYPFLRPDLFSGLREPARGMLLFGPPGTGKTMLARAVATESKSTFFSISASSLTSKFLGESEKLVRALFELGKALAPSIIFVDEIDSLLSQRSDTGEHEASRRIKNEFLVRWSELQSAAAGKEKEDVNRVLVLAATNIPWAIDEAARRRFVRRQYIPLPEADTRLHHIKKLMANQTHALTEEDFKLIVEKTERFSGSDLTALAKDAAMGPLRSLGDALLTTPRDQIRSIGISDFLASLNTIRPSVSIDGLKGCEEWAAMYGSSGA